MKNNTISPIMQANATSILGLKKSLDFLKKQYETQCAELLTDMVKHGLDEIAIENLGKITLQEESERLITDNNRLKSVYAEIYNDCVKVSKVKAHLVVKL